MQIRQAGTRGTDHSNRITRVPCFIENYTPYLPRSPHCIPSRSRLNRQVRFSCVRQTARCTCLCAHRGVAYHRLSNYRGIVAARGKFGNQCRLWGTYALMLLRHCLPGPIFDRDNLAINYSENLLIVSTTYTLSGETLDYWPSFPRCSPRDRCNRRRSNESIPGEPASGRWGLHPL